MYDDCLHKILERDCGCHLCVPLSPLLLWPVHAQRSEQPGLVYGDFLYRVFGWLGKVVWRTAGLMAKVLSLLLPQT